MACADLEDYGALSSSEAVALEAMAEDLARVASVEASAPVPALSRFPWGSSPCPPQLLQAVLAQVKDVRAKVQAGQASSSVLPPKLALAAGGWPPLKPSDAPPLPV